MQGVLIWLWAEFMDELRETHRGVKPRRKSADAEGVYEGGGEDEEMTIVTRKPQNHNSCAWQFCKAM